MTRVHTTIDSPIDPITLVAENGVLCGLFMDAHKGRPDEAAFGETSTREFVQVIEELEQYFAGERTAFDVATAPLGSEFQQLVWNALRQIPYGETWSYGQQAAFIGKPGAARAVGGGKWAESDFNNRAVPSSCWCKWEVSWLRRRPSPQRVLAGPRKARRSTKVIRLTRRSVRGF